MATAKHLHDVMECPICTELYMDPRVLPCIHTFCLKCIKELSKDKQPGDKLACPLCRKEFAVPSNGVDDLPKNFCVANFLEVRELQMKSLSNVESETSPCEACSSGEESESGVQNEASVFCVQCQIKLCKICERVHKVSKLTLSHKLVQIGEHVDVNILYQSMPPAICQEHESKKLKYYCLECKSAICMECFVERHKNHDCSNISKVEVDLRNQMTSDIGRMPAGVDKCREMLESLEKERNEFVKQVEEARVGISEKAEQLKQMIDVLTEKLMTELSSMKQERMKEIESLREEIERQLLSMESYAKYVDEVRQKGTACDIARAASDLHDRADELLKFDVIERTLADLGHVDVTFAISDFVIDDVKKTLGDLQLRKSTGYITVFTARRYASAVYAICLSVRLSAHHEPVFSQNS